MMETTSKDFTYPTRFIETTKAETETKKQKWRTSSGQMDLETAHVGLSALESSPITGKHQDYVFYLSYS